jgi:glycosyltransferase involved in cell wall biosynthesis
LRIAIDAHSVGTQLAGNESYATNLIEALAQIDKTNEYTLYVTKTEAVERFHRRWPNFDVRQTVPHTPLIRIPLILSAELRKRPVDVLHVQFTAPPASPCPVVVSIHDLSFEHLPQTFTRRSRTQLRLTVRYSARVAARVIVPTDYGKNDLATTYKIPPEKIDVIPLAAGRTFSPASEKDVQRVRQTYVIQDEYILSVGSIQPRKNLPRLIAAFARLRSTWSNGKLPKLVLVGKQAWLYDETIRAIESAGIEDSVILTGYVPAADLPALYTGATCFVYPSYFEGFGLPPLEAMRCGTPVITGNTTSLPEVVGDAALTVDPFSVEALESGIKKLLINPDLRATLRVKGLAQAEGFNWQDTARETLAVYQRAYQIKERASARSATRDS